MKAWWRYASILPLLFAAALPLFAEKVATIPAPTGYIDDYASVLSASAVSDMEAIARELHDKTRAQVFLVTINTLEGEPVEQFANELFAKWKIGEKKTDRGLLMLFAIKDHKRWIEVGYGLEGILNDAKVGDIGREMVPGLRAQNYDEATKLGIDKICTIIAEDSGVTLDSLASSTKQLAQDSSSTSIEETPAAHNPTSFWVLMALGLLGPAAIGIILVILSRRALRRRGVEIVGLDSRDAWSGRDSSFDSGSSFSSDDSFGGGDGGSSGGGGAGGDW